ncbi:hypothetical protein EN35_12490 [Rhodococcus qingshengii]|nr:hypothetical protein EN35_12490 [Rhodococcus qingshengii]
MPIFWVLLGIVGYHRIQQSEKVPVIPIDQEATSWLGESAICIAAAAAKSSKLASPARAKARPTEWWAGL